MVAFYPDWTRAFATALAASSVNKNEVKFDQMVRTLTLSPAAIECIDNPRSRILFRGVEAGCRDEQIITAFRICYRDLAPIRVAGDLIFGQLTTLADEAAERVDAMDESLVVKTNADVAATLATSRRLFDLIDGDNSGGLDRDELLASPQLLAIIRSGKAEDNDNENVVDRFMELADENGDGVISFVEFANAAATQPQLRLVDDALSTALLSAASESASDDSSTKKKKGRFGRKLPDERFEDMLQQCLDWEESLGCGPGNNDDVVIDDLTECTVDVNFKKQPNNGDDEEGRLLQVLKGTLVGARCGPVVDALKMCYLDYSPLRLGGDIIFKLLGRIVKTQLPKQ